jgi:hypothetical protein
MTRWVIFETNKKDLRPEILIERMLGFDDSEIIAGRNNASIQDHEIIFAWGENHLLLATRSQAEQQSGAAEGSDFTGDFAGQIIFHG